ncbi:MAG: CorA family divalent cation transporter [Nanoarchaeota archaeon]|mgnify:CR=1 FL=1
MIEYFIRNEKGIIEKIDKCNNGCLVFATAPNDDEISFLSEKFKLRKENLTDATDIYEIPRFEKEENKIYLFLTVPTEKINQEFASSFAVIYSKENLIIITKHSLEIFDEILKPEKKVKDFSSSKNLLRILFFIHRSFEKSIRTIMKETKHSKTDLNKLNNKNIEKIIKNEERLNYYISSFETLIKTYNQILTEKIIKFSKRDKVILTDLIVDLTGDLNLSINTIKTTSNMRNYYSTKLSNDLNRTVTALTIFTIFLAIPTLISSIYGMNIGLPNQTSPDLFIDLGIIVLGIWVVMFSVLRFLRVI